AAAALATFAGDRVGRRRLLIALAALGAAGTLAFVAAADSLPLLALTAFLGMLNGMGRDRGAALILEQAALPATTTDAGRTRIVAVYTMLQDVGHGLGALAAGLPTLLARSGWSAADATGAALGGVAALGLLTLPFYGSLGNALEASPAGPRRPVSPTSRRHLTRLAALFGIDSLAGGFLTTALLSYFFYERFGVEEAALGGLFFGARVLNALSHLAAARLALRIGLVNTMVFTHIPSSLLLVTVAFAPSFPVAAALFLLREGLVEMDVPTRTSYVLAVVAPEERTFASGITNLVRLAGWALGPLVAGLLMRPDQLWPPLLVGAGMKIAYDLLLWKSFRNLPPPEEREREVLG
ncbi:MAG TPA: MFS transporter, partial [Thermoanaerobaculia bacterium]|nr:MFS transporter [Thermoanaerobaculia bacterium]